MRVFALTLALTLAGSSALADPVPGSFYDPASPGVWTWRSMVGATVDILPLRLVASELREIPRAAVGVRVGMPYGFSLEGTAQAVVLDNQLLFGATWGARFGRFSVGAALRGGAGFGWVGVSGFDTFAFGLQLLPSVALSAQVLDSRLTLTATAIVVGGQRVRIGDEWLRRGLTTYAGVSATLTVETAVSRRGMIYYGAGIIVASPDYQLWLAFSEDNTRRPFPRFFIGYEF